MTIGHGSRPHTAGQPPPGSRLNTSKSNDRIPYTHIGGHQPAWMDTTMEEANGMGKSTSSAASLTFENEEKEEGGLDAIALFRKQMKAKDGILDTPVSTKPSTPSVELACIFTSSFEASP